MSWPRWTLVCVLATVEALLVSIGAGDFDGEKRTAHRQAAIEQARTTSGVDGHVAAAAQGDRDGQR
jgi:protein involved in temperature-dependent protein secretion